MDSYLNAYHGICVGGMFFKVEDTVHITGKGLNGKQKMEATGMILHVDKKSIHIVRSDFCYVVFDINRITSIEHIKEKLC